MQVPVRVVHRPTGQATMNDDVRRAGALDERDSAAIGIVEAVSPNQIEVAVLREAPHGTGLREGVFHRFPRINSYVVLPSERGSILAIVTWVGVSDDPSEVGRQSDRIGLPVPQRRLRALPLGVLRRIASLLLGGEPVLELDRGVLLFPTVGDPVRLPTQAESRAAVPTTGDGCVGIRLGRAPLANDAELSIDPNRLFGRHLGVLGNTGSGKSCTIAQLLRSSATAVGPGLRSFRAIVLDLNGEYRHAFDDLGGDVLVRHFSVRPDAAATQLRVPYWLWNYREWMSFTEASAKSQAPQLRRCLHLLRTTETGAFPRAVLGLVAGRRIIREYEAGAVERKANPDCLSVLDNVPSACRAVQAAADSVTNAALERVSSSVEGVLASRRGSGEYIWKYGAPQLDHEECQTLLPLFDVAIDELGIPEFLGDGLTVDMPLPFDARNLLELLPILASDSGPEAVGWVAPLVERLRIAMADDRLEAISGWRPDESLGAWLETYLADASANQISVIDLSLVPTHVLHLIAAVFSRLLLEALERHGRNDEATIIPTILIVEEAHAVARRHVGYVDEEATVPAVRLCREAFERIAREGRKFGLSLVVSSQRPSELSETVLSQCNTFMIHRLVNDHDQTLVRRLVPDSLGALTEELPALPSQTALTVGWAMDVPTLVRVSDLAERYRPRSPDPDYASTWTGETIAEANWGRVADEWVGLSDEQQGTEPGPMLNGGDRIEPTQRPQQTSAGDENEDPF